MEMHLDIVKLLIKCNVDVDSKSKYNAIKCIYY